MNIFLKELSETFMDDFIVLACDRAAGHKSKGLNFPENVELVFIPSYTSEMNPIEQIWKQIRMIGLKMKFFPLLKKLLKGSL